MPAALLKLVYRFTYRRKVKAFASKLHLFRFLYLPETFRCVEKISFLAGLIFFFFFSCQINLNVGLFPAGLRVVSSMYFYGEFTCGRIWFIFMFKGEENIFGWMFQGESLLTSFVLSIFWWIFYFFMFRCTLRPQGMKKVRATGIGVHTAEEIVQMGKDDLQVLIDMLGDKTFFFGDEPTTVSPFFLVFRNYSMHFDGISPSELFSFSNHDSEIIF